MVLCEIITGIDVGACFKVQTGDIEEAPAWDALPCFKTTIDGNDISVEINDLGTLSSCSHIFRLFITYH